MATTTTQTATRSAQEDISSAVSRWMQGEALSDRDALIVAYGSAINRAVLLDHIIASMHTGTVQ